MKSKTPSKNKTKKLASKNKIIKHDINMIKHMKIYELVKHESIAQYLFSKGMLCIACPLAMNETLEQAAVAHGIDADELAHDIYNLLNKSKTTNAKTTKK